MLQIGDLVEQLRDDILREVSLRLLLRQPGVVLGHELLRPLVVGVVEWPGVALLVDELLTIGQSLLKLNLLLAKLLDAVNLLVLLKFLGISLGLLSRSLLLFRVLDLKGPVGNLLLNGIELSLAFLCHGVTESIKTLLVLLSDLLDKRLSVNLAVHFFILLGIESLASRLFLDELPL